jgi:transcriptional regulator with XRE-family HTH domain
MSKNLDNTETVGPSRDLRENFLKSRPDVQKAWDASAHRRAISLALVHLRTRKNLSQAEVAKRASWNKSYVSRLESIDDASIPDTETIVRYAQACRMDVGLVFTEPQGQHRVVDVVALQVEHGATAMESLRDKALVEMNAPLRSSK